MVVYSQQLQSGQDYRALRPTYAIWLLGEDLLKDDPADAHHYRLRDERGRMLLAHGGINLFELSKRATRAVETEEQRWLKFFKDGERLDADRLPEWMQTREMRQAMSTLKRFSDKERAYHAYQARQRYLRMQGSIARHQQDLAARQQELEVRQQALEEALAQERAAREAALGEIEAERLSKEAERQAKEAALQEKDAALAQLARLEARLRADHPQGEG